MTAQNIIFAPKLEEYSLLSQKFNLIPVHAEILADTITPISAYINIVGDASGFLLESVEGGERMGRYTFIGFDSSEIIYTDGKDPLSEISERFDSLKPFHDPQLPRFFGGAVGFIGYDCISYFEPKILETHKKFKRPSLNLPEAGFMISDTLLIFDHIKRRIRIVVNTRIDSSNCETEYNKACEKIRKIAGLLNNPFDASYFGSQPDFSKELVLESNCSKNDFEAAVLKAKEYILAGDIFQVVLSQRFERKTNAEPFQVYRALRAINPSPYMFFLNFPGTEKYDSFSLVGSSPEVMVRIENGKITLRPIAGTRPRGETLEKDRDFEKELLSDEKECAEHIMLVDLGRNDVGRAAKPGSVAVDELMVIERYSHVMHIVSNVVGELDDKSTAYDVIRSAFPAGTVSGAPKIRAMEIIRELESTARGTYAGAAGYIGFDGNADTAIILRTILLTKGKAYVQAGAGIVYDSVPEREYEESVNKAMAMMRALEWAEKNRK